MKWTPSADDYRLAARVLRATARRMTELPWWERWQYPIDKLRKYAANFEEHADLLSPNARTEPPPENAAGSQKGQSNGK